jgi:hypothetical protein
MPSKHRNVSFKSRQKGQSKSKTKSQKGGNQGPYPDSAWGFQLNNVGDLWNQFTRTMDSSSTSNVITPAHAPVAAAHAQKGGKAKSRSRGRGRGKKGGYWGAVLEQAIVPLTLLGMQQKFKTRRHHNVAKNKSIRRK